MRRLHFFCVGAIVASSIACAEPAGTVQNDCGREVHKLLAEAQLSASLIHSPADRNAALNSIGITYIRAGDESAALAIDKKIDTTETPRPIQRALALAQLRAGRIDEALFTLRLMKDPDAISSTLITLAEASEKAGDSEMAVRFCKLVGGESRLDALLLASRIQQNAGDLDGAEDSMGLAKTLAHRQYEVAKVAEAEALGGNLQRADRLMARLHRENDRARVLAAMVSYEAKARDFAGADDHMTQIESDSYRSAALRELALAHLDAGEIKEAFEQANAIPELDVQFKIYCALTTRELDRDGIDAARAVAMKISDGPAKAACLSIIATAIAKSGQTDSAKKTMAESQAALFHAHDPPPDWAVEAVCENFATVDRGGEALDLVLKITDADLRAEAIQKIVRVTARQQEPDESRKLIERANNVRERTAALVGMAEGLLDRCGK